MVVVPPLLATLVSFMDSKKVITWSLYDYVMSVLLPSGRMLNSLFAKFIKRIRLAENFLLLSGPQQLWRKLYTCKICLSSCYRSQLKPTLHSTDWKIDVQSLFFLVLLFVHRTRWYNRKRSGCKRKTDDSTRWGVGTEKNGWKSWSWFCSGVFCGLQQFSSLIRAVFRNKAFFFSEFLR